MKALFCGLGSIGQRHLRNLKALLGDGVELLAYRERGLARVLEPDMTVRTGAALESTYGIRSFDRLDAALAEQPDAVFVTNPNSAHLRVARAAAEAGCHLFIEKPLSHSLDGVEALIELVEDKGLVALVGYQFRFHPGLAAIKALIDTDRVGRIVAAHIVNGEYLPDWHPYEDYRGTHPARRDLGGGTLRIQTHELDYALWLLGKATKVYAVGGHLSQLEVDVEDSVSLLLTCTPDDRPVPVHVHLDYLQRPPQRICEVVGDAGRARFDYYARRVDFWELATGKATSQCFDEFDREQMFQAELRHFLACMRGEARPIVDLREAARSLAVSLAAEASLRTGKAVDLS
jgi:predicted dehydrogenase